jgi:hypothetical protein
VAMDFDICTWFLVLLERPKVTQFSFLHTGRKFMVRPWIYITGKFKSTYIKNKTKQNITGWKLLKMKLLLPIIQKCI